MSDSLWPHELQHTRLPCPSPTPGVYLNSCHYLFIQTDTPSQVALVVKNLPSNAGDIRDVDTIPGMGRPPGVGNGNPLQYSCLENSMDRGVWRTAFHRVTNNGVWLKQHSRHLGKPSNCPSFVQAFVFKNSQCKDYAGDTAGINMHLIFPIFSLGNKQE